MFEALHPPTIIAFGAVISVLAVIFYALLYPVREKIEDLKAGQKDLGKKIDDLYKILLSDRKNQK